MQTRALMRARKRSGRSLVTRMTTAAERERKPARFPIVKGLTSNPQGRLQMDSVVAARQGSIPRAPAYVCHWLILLLVSRVAGL